MAGGATEMGAGGAGVDDGGVPPIVWYTHRDAAGDVTEGPGTALNVVLRFDTSDALYLEGVTDVQELDTLTPAEIVSRLVPTDMWSRERPTNFGHTPIHEGSVEIRFAE